MNSLGMVTGYDSDWGWNYRFRVVDGVLVDRTRIPPVPNGTSFRYHYEEGYSHALALNEHGQVVGYIRRQEEGATVTYRRAYLWSGDTTVPARELGVFPSGTESVAEDINDGGFVAGYANEVVLAGNSGRHREIPGLLVSLTLRPLQAAAARFRRLAQLSGDGFE